MIPQAKKRPVEIIQHGFKRIDNYAWLRDENWKEFIKGNLDFSNPEVKKYLEAEAEHTKSQMRETVQMQDQLYQEILGRIQEDDETCPFPRNDYFYYQRTEAGKDYPLLCRKKGSLDSAEEIYFDVNFEAEGKNLYIMGRSIPNDANTYLAYCFNLTGSLERTLKVRDLRNGNDFDWEIPNTNGDFFWVNNNEILFIERGESARGQKVFRFDIHEGPSSKVLIFNKPEDLDGMFMSLGKTTDRKFHFLYLSSGSSQRVYYKSKDSDGYHLFASGENDVTYNVEHQGNHFYILTNEGDHHNFMIYTCPSVQVSRSHWKVYLEEDSNNYVSSIDIYGTKMALMRQNQKKAIPELVVIDLQTKNQKLIPMEDEVYDLSFLGAYDPHSEWVRLSYQSCKQPPQDLEVHLATGEVRVLKSKHVPNFDPHNYEIHREFAAAHDGEEIPLTIVYKKGLKKDRSSRVFIYGYGSYGIGMPAYFSPGIFSLIDRDFVFVIAHIRGGDDKGYQWYLDGKRTKKLNTFKDFISSCEHMIQAGYTQKGNIVANGGSAGGLLMGAVTNMRPDLFKCVIADVAFVDVINTISDPTLPLTPPEWEEWGNPIESKEDYEYMMSYSPYDNIQPQNYPAMLYNSGISDEQVTYWEPAKMVAKLRELKTDKNLLLLHIKMHAGHAGASKRYESIKDRAFNFAFVLKSFGLI